VPGCDTPGHTLNAGSSSSVLEQCWHDDPAQRAQLDNEFLAAPGYLDTGEQAVTEKKS
jgi:hypothetical protein